MCIRDRCAVTEDLLDYSQFKPRGYYEGDETLETYFRAMMWYGQINFTQKKEDMNRTALLITLALHDTASDSWEKLYTVTSFFAGVSDDLGYYEYLPAIEAAYGTIPDTEPVSYTHLDVYKRQTLVSSQMEPSRPNSVFQRSA